MSEHRKPAILAPNAVENLHNRKNEIDSSSSPSDFSKAHLLKEIIELRKRETLYRSLLENSQELIFSMQGDGKIIWSNQKASEVMAILQKVSSAPSIIWNEEKLPATQGPWMALVEQMNDRYFETQLSIQCYEKTRNYFVRIILDEEPDPIESTYWFYLADTTEMQLATEDVIRKKTMLESISNSVQEGIFRSNKAEGIIYVNQAFAKMFGYDSVEEVMQVDPYDLYMDPSRRDDFVKIIEKQDSFFNEEVEFKRKDGSSFWGLVSSVPYYDSSGTRYHDGAIRDVTQLREVERGLKENFEELQKVNRELDRFVYSTSHDLRAPLVSISGLISIMRTEQEEKLRLKYLDLMDRSIQKLDDFIKDIIGYSRNARMELKNERIDFQNLLEESFQAHSPKGVSSNIQTILNIEADEVFISDKNRLNTIFNNLLSNAFRYSDSQKENSFIKVEVTVKNKRAFIHVQDNGIGIAPKYLDKIFQMFYRATQKSQGSGIGLYIVKEAIEKLKGTIQVNSQLGVGTEFLIEIPSGTR